MAIVDQPICGENHQAHAVTEVRLVHVHTVRCFHVRWRKGSRWRVRGNTTKRYLDYCRNRPRGVVTVACSGFVWIFRLIGGWWAAELRQARELPCGGVIWFTRFRKAQHLHPKSTDRLFPINGPLQTNTHVERWVLSLFNVHNLVKFKLYRNVMQQILPN